MEKNYHKKNIQRLVTGIILVVVFVGGIFIGRLSQANSNTNQNPADALTVENQDFTQFWKVWKLLNDKYPFKEKVPTDQERIQGAIAGMVSSFKDPYTTFFPPKEAQLFADDVKGQFGGVGMEVGIKDGVITVIAPLKNSPADKAGIIRWNLLNPKHKIGYIIINNEKENDISISDIPFYLDSSKVY
jgi:carboxyl-terminal processing protease